MCLVCIFILYFHFLFSFFENYFYFQNIRILKTCLVWLLVFCFHEIKILKIYDILTSCLFAFLDLFKITFIVTRISFYPKWDFCFQLKTRFYSLLYFSLFLLIYKKISILFPIKWINKIYIFFFKPLFIKVISLYLFNYKKLIIFFF